MRKLIWYFAARAVNYRTLNTATHRTALAPFIQTAPLHNCSPGLTFE